MKNSHLKSLKILCVGNSFSVDTMQYVPNIAANLGIEKIRLGNLYIGGCSINRHWENVKNNSKAYKYYTNNGAEWKHICDVGIEETVGSEDWDWISIQHGTGDGSRYTLEESYQNLPCLIEFIRSKTSPKTKVAFNMAWVMESYGTHPEIRSYEGNQMLMYQNLTELTERLILPMKGLDRISPAGTAIQNARATQLCDRLSRDGFHLSLDIGRYIAGLTFLKALTDVNIDNVTWIPDGVTEEDRQIAITVSDSAIKNPFHITEH